MKILRYALQGSEHILICNKVKPIADEVFHAVLHLH